MKTTLTRRDLIGAAGVAAVGLAMGDAVALADERAPRLPMAILLRGGLSDDYVTKI